MDRRRFLFRTLQAVAATAALRHAALAGAQAPKVEKLVKTDDEWRKILTPAQYSVLRQEGTEPPFTSPLNSEKRKGIFACAGCDLPLFDSNTKYDSGTGWPSFYDVIPGRLETKRTSSCSTAHRVPLRALRRAPRARVQRRPEADRPALLQQRRRAEVRSGLSGPRAQVARRRAAGARRRDRGRRGRRAFRYNFRFCRPCRPSGAARRHGTRQKLRTPRHRGEVVPALGVARLLQADARDAGAPALLHPASAAQRDRHAAHGPRVPA